MKNFDNNKTKGIIQINKLITLSVIGMLLIPLTFHKAENISIITPQLINAIIKVESNFNHKAISKKKAYGLMQVRYSVWKDELKKRGIIKTKQDLFSKKKNIEAGTFILNHYLLKNNNDLRKALHKYSGGANNYYEKVMANLLKEER